MDTTARMLVHRFQQARHDEALAVLEGFHALKHAIRFGAEIELAVSRDTAVVGALAANLAGDVQGRMMALLQSVPDPLFAQLSNGQIETGLIAIAKRRVVTQATMLAHLTAPIVLLESPSHLGNVGAVVRVAAGAGAAGVLTTGPHDPWHPSVLRGAAGLHYAVPVARALEIQFAGRELLAIDPDGEDLLEGTIPDNAVLAFGSERSGLSDGLLRAASRRVRIPMEAGVSSLNLATSVAVVLYHWRLGRNGRSVGQ